MIIEAKQGLSKVTWDDICRIVVYLNMLIWMLSGPKSTKHKLDTVRDQLRSKLQSLLNHTRLHLITYQFTVYIERKMTQFPSLEAESTQTPIRLDSSKSIGLGYIYRCSPEHLFDCPLSYSFHCPP